MLEGNNYDDIKWPLQAGKKYFFYFGALHVLCVGTSMTLSHCMTITGFNYPVTILVYSIFYFTIFPLLTIYFTG